MPVRELDHLQAVNVARMVYPQPELLLASKIDVLVVTPWLAPIVWEGTFNIDILDEQFWLENATIGLTVFALEEYMHFLKLFLETAEAHFMVGHRLKYYIFTNQPDHVPLIKPREGRQMVILEAQSYACHMEVISNFSQQRFLREVDYLVCSDVDVKFNDHVGVEILSSLFGTLHPGYLGLQRESFAYERRPQSQAYIPEDEGDFYYTGALFGGSVLEVYRLAKACHQAMMIDQANDIKARWHDESYLNKYLLHRKPTKVLSPEYMWDKQLLTLLVDEERMIEDLWMLRITKQLATNDGYVQEELEEELWTHEADSSKALQLSSAWQDVTDDGHVTHVTTESVGAGVRWNQSKPVYLSETVSSSVK
ncbi:histo-blood group ABO system transferase-like [Nycticebus coucang]|uniref:histo-blood group ABO system transferase-like n=1 Tax=Nycticebus coucang TaxID=9470 RepID=UPI00234D9762|nr:histo-blood group ABO system transferase-like [Nycticebus coucang]